jgi:hypothetical protein
MVINASIAKKRNIITKKFHFSTELSDVFSKMGLIIKYDIPIFKEDKNKKANPTFSKFFFAITFNINKVTFEKIKKRRYKMGMLY